MPRSRPRLATRALGAPPRTPCRSRIVTRGAITQAAAATTLRMPRSSTAPAAAFKEPARLTPSHYEITQTKRPRSTGSVDGPQQATNRSGSSRQTVRGVPPLPPPPLTARASEDYPAIRQSAAASAQCRVSLTTTHPYQVAQQWNRAVVKCPHGKTRGEVRDDADMTHDARVGGEEGPWPRRPPQLPTSVPRHPHHETPATHRTLCTHTAAGQRTTRPHHATARRPTVQRGGVPIGAGREVRARPPTQPV